MVEAGGIVTSHLAIIDATDARVLTDQIKTGVEAVWHLITRAYTQRAWSALGYQSWDDYCTREFGTTRLRLPREERAEVVASLRESGLSIRAIASATGVARGTVQREIASGVPFGTPDPADDAAESDALAEELIAAAPAPAVTVTGKDGKTYRPRQPKPASASPQPTPEPEAKPARRRKPLIDTARDLALDLEKISRRIENFGADDRLAGNKEEVAPRLRYHLNYAIKVCQDLNRQLSNGGAVI